MKGARQTERKKPRVEVRGTQESELRSRWMNQHDCVGIRNTRVQTRHLLHCHFMAFRDFSIPVFSRNCRWTLIFHGSLHSPISPPRNEIYSVQLMQADESSVKNREAERMNELASESTLEFKKCSLSSESLPCAHARNRSILRCPSSDLKIPTKKMGNG